MISAVTPQTITILIPNILSNWFYPRLGAKMKELFDFVTYGDTGGRTSVFCMFFG